MDKTGDTGVAGYRIDRGEVLRYLGYAGQALDQPIGQRIDEMMARCLKVSNPGFVYRVFPIDVADAAVRLEGTTLEVPGADIVAHLGGARECAVMAATAGLGNERELQRLARTGGLDGILFDACGSALAEAVADACNAAIIAEARTRGLFAKWRYSPGYGDVPLDVQPAIVRVLSADKRLGISVTESNLLIPAKSVTALVGLFDTPQEEARSCSTCPFAPYCDLRRKGTPCCR